VTPPIPAIAANAPAAAARALARTRLAVLPTPLVAAPRLAEASNWPGARTSRWRCRPAAAQQALALAQQSLRFPETGREVDPVDVTVIDARAGRAAPGPHRTTSHPRSRR